MSSPPKPVSQAPIVEQPYIQTHSADNVRKWIKQGIKNHSLKDCSNLDMDIVKLATKARFEGEPDEEETFFIPVCRHRSFKSNIGHLADDAQLRMLRYGLNQLPIECPKDCTFYEHRRAGWIKENTRHLFESAYTIVVDLLKGYAALQWPTQVFLILLVVLIVAPKWVPPLIQLVKAVTGK
jgi:hypothetical protein